MRVIMAESSDIYRDGRVQKEARTLVECGYDVVVFGFRSAGTVWQEFPFSLTTLPVASRKHRLLRNLSILLNLVVLNIRILFEKGQVYHAHNTMFLLSMFISSRLHRGKFVYDAHEVQIEAGRIQAWLEGKFIHKADEIINVSEGRAAYQARQYGLEVGNITLIHNYPDLSNAEVAEHKIGRTIRMVFSGGFHLGDNRLDLFVRLLAGVPGIALDLIAFGYGDSEERLKEIIKELNLQDTVRFLPLVPFSDLIPTLASYDVAVDMLTNPEESVSKRYPAINKTYEYFAAGLPIICSNMPAFIEEVEMQGAGLSINPVDEQAGRAELLEFLSDHERMDTMRTKARSLSRERYNWSIEHRRLQEMYGRLES